MRLGATLGFNPALGGYDPDALAYFAALATAPSAGFKSVVNTLVSSLKSAGIWTGLDTFYILASEADGVDDYGINLVNPGTYTLTNTNTPTWTQYVGTQGNAATSYHTGPTAMNALTNFVEDNCSMGLWLNALNATNAGLIGDTNAENQIVRLTNNANWQIRLNTLTNFTLNNSTPYSTVPHSFIASRTATTTTNGYYDGAADETASAQDSDQALDAGDFRIHHSNGQFSDGQMAFVFLGRGLSAAEALAMHNAMAAANTSLAAL